MCGFSDLSYTMHIFLGFIFSVAFHSAIPFVGFGFLDNAVMIIAVSILVYSIYTVYMSLLLVLVLAPRIFLRVFCFSSLHKNQHFNFNRNTQHRKLLALNTTMSKQR